MAQALTNTQTSRKKTNILSIAPYESMKTIMQKLADERDDINLDVFVGDLQKGVEIACRNHHSDYDVIISRGGTAQLINQITRIPVVEVGLSVYDILRVIKLSENYSGKYAIVGFPNITADAHLLCELLRYKIDIFTVYQENEVEGMLSDLIAQGYQMVLCDMITHTTAKRLGLNALLITSGKESISAALHQAVKLSTNYHILQSEKRFYLDILEGENDQIIILKEDGEVFFSTADEEQQPALYELLQKDLPSVLSGKMHKFFKNLNGTLYSFTCRTLSFLGEQYAVFYFSSNSVPFATSKYGIRFSNLQEEEDIFFNNFFSITNSSTTIRTAVQNINQTSFPVMISGETGSGKEQVARIIYSESRLCGNPLITANCTLLNERSWNYLTNHYNSPFNDNNNTIYLKDINALSNERRRQLLSIIIDTNLCRRNRMIFSYSCPTGQGLPADAMEFVNLLSCVTIHLPPLREHANEIPTLASLYLNMLNVSMTNQIIGLDPDALKLLQEYSWPYNYTQFKRILNELALVTTTPYIRAEHVSALLEKNKEPMASVLSNAAKSEEKYSLDLDRPLCDITKEIIQIVLAETNGNQSAAAKKLGIGRSTLWRYLKIE